MAPPTVGQRSWALAAIAGQVVASDPSDGGRVARAVELAGTISDDRQRSQALVAIAGMVGDVTRFDMSVGWKRVDFGDLLGVAATLASRAQDHHPELALATMVAVMRVAGDFR